MRVVPGLKAGLALSDACDLVARAFRERGIESPQADARILAAHALALTRAQLIAQADRELEPREIDAISARAARRLEREPVSRIVGTREFWGLTLEIDPAVLDPRPDTETVIEMALDWITTRGLRREKLRVLDIGTGSGALLLALLSELPEAFGVGTDISVEAQLTARRERGPNRSCASLRFCCVRHQRRIARIVRFNCRQSSLYTERRYRHFAAGSARL
jgi:release factor glutamine methyltransferase